MSANSRLALFLLSVGCSLVTPTRAYTVFLVSFLETFLVHHSQSAVRIALASLLLTYAYDFSALHKMVLLVHQHFHASPLLPYARHSNADGSRRTASCRSRSLFPSSAPKDQSNCTGDDPQSSFTLGVSWLVFLGVPQGSGRSPEGRYDERPQV